MFSKDRQGNAAVSAKILGRASKDAEEGGNVSVESIWASASTTNTNQEPGDSRQTLARSWDVFLNLLIW